MRTPKTLKLLLLIVLIVIFAYGGILFQDYAEGRKGVSFTGVIIDVEDTRAGDGDCVLNIDRKKVAVEFGGFRIVRITPLSLFKKITGTDSLQGKLIGVTCDESAIGKQVSVFAKPDGEYTTDYVTNYGYFTLYGSTKYFVKLLEENEL